MGADADPYLLYGGYGLGYAGHYGYAGYPYTMDTTERDLLMLSQRLMLIPISCTEDMALAMLDIMDMLDTHTPMDTTERDLMMLSHRLMLMLLSFMEDMDMDMDTEPTDMDTHM